MRGMSGLLLLIIGLSACVQNTPPGIRVTVSGNPTTSTSCNTALTLCSYNRGAVSGAKQKVEFQYSIAPDCTSLGYATVRIVTPPAHGQLTIEQGLDYTSFAKDNQRYECNKQRSPGVLVFYTSEPGFIGTDSAVTEVLYPSGNSPRTINYTISVR